MRYKFKKEQKAEIENARRENKEKQTERRLYALSLCADGVKLEEIATRTGHQRSSVSLLIRKYFQQGIKAVVGNHCGGNRRNMSIEQEAALLEKHREKAEKGHMIDVQKFKQEYEREVGHRIGSGQIYRVLNRHGWRKIMPRSKHPKRTSEEEIASSKKQHSNQGDAESFPQARQSMFNVSG